MLELSRRLLASVTLLERGCGLMSRTNPNPTDADWDEFLADAATFLGTVRT